MKKACVPVLFAFALGALAGAAADRRCSGKGWDRGGLPEMRHERMLERFTRDLGLSAEQRPKVAAVLESTRERLKSLKEESRPRFEAVKNASRAEIRALLDPAQQEKFDRLAAERDARRRNGREGHFSH